MTWVLGLVLWGALADTTVRAPAEPGRQVLTRADIEAAGLVQLPDLFRLVTGARTATVDGLSWRQSLRNAAPFGAEPWAVLVDGERVELGLFGEHHLVLLPFTIADVDSVEVERRPQRVAGAFADGGVIHLHTRRPARGLTSSVRISAGSETGDPGPFEYVPALRTPNVERKGPYVRGLIGYGERGWRLRASYKLFRLFSDDPAVLDRNRQALGNAPPRLFLTAAGVEAEADALGGRHGVRLYHSGFDDLWFFQPLGRELPVHRTLTQGGVSGRLPFTQRVDLAYRLYLIEDRLDEREGSGLGLDPAWHARTVRGGLGLHRTLGALAATLGTSVERTTAEGAEGFTLAHLVTTFAHTPSPRRHHRFDAGLAVAGGRAAVSAALHARRATRSGLRFGATAALTQRLPEETQRFGFWRARGYAAFDAALDYRQPRAPGTATQVLLSLDGRRPLSPPLALAAGAALQVFRGAQIETQPLAPDPDVLPRLHVVESTTDAAGEVLSGWATLHLRQGVWRGRLFYDGQTPIDGDATFERAWAPVPRHRAGAAVTVTPAPSFSAWASLTWRSAARWPAYGPLDGSNDGLYESALPDAWLLDASVRKTFWQHRLRTSLLLRNLLNVEERYHPVGSRLDLRFLLTVELVLGSWAGI